jgi:tetratricopeptide (TPR) repeat protein
MFPWFKRRKDPLPSSPTPPAGPPDRARALPETLVLGSASASLLLGAAALAAGQLMEALVYFDHVIALAPENAAGHAYRGQVLAALGREDAALSAFEEALRLDALHTPALLARGLLHQGQVRTTQALADYTMIIEAALAQEDWVRARYQRALLYHQLGDRYQAEQGYKEALALQPGYPPATNMLASMCLERGTAARDERWIWMAVNLLTRSIEAHPDDLTCRVTRGQAFVLLGQFARARDDLEVALQSHNQTVQAHAQELLATIEVKAQV